MASKTATDELELMGGSGPGGFGAEGFGLPGGGGGAAVPQRVYVTGIWLALASILMFFTALTSAFLVRRGLANDWVPFALPRILWGTTAVLLLSSVTLERARRRLAQRAAGEFRLWWGLTTALGLIFLAGQLVAWRQLAAAGVYLATNPSSSFFYLLTGAHGAHLLGGVIALFYVGFRGRATEGRLSQQTAATVVSIYWHFLSGLWVFLFLLLHLGR